MLLSKRFFTLYCLKPPNFEKKEFKKIIIRRIRSDSQQSSKGAHKGLQKVIKEMGLSILVNLFVLRVIPGYHLILLLFPIWNGNVARFPVQRKIILV